MSTDMLVRSSVAPMHAEARVSSVQISQRLAGHAVAVLETQRDWLRVRGEDAYEGWMHRGYLHANGTSIPHGGARLLSLGCMARDTSTAGVRALPLGAWLEPTERVETGNAINEVARRAAFPRDASGIATTAVQLFAGAPYQWGGVSPWGADCSGLTQTAFWLHGVSVPRDAWQQAEVGQDAGSEMSTWTAGDLLFFSDRADRRITHVGIALGEKRMVHLALGRGGYSVERLDATDDPYVAGLMRRFVVARRVV